jgi:hypothetical protein
MSFTRLPATSNKPPPLNFLPCLQMCQGPQCKRTTTVKALLIRMTSLFNFNFIVILLRLLLLLLLCSRLQLCTILSMLLLLLEIVTALSTLTSQLWFRGLKGLGYLGLFSK